MNLTEMISKEILKPGMEFCRIQDDDCEATFLVLEDGTIRRSRITNFDSDGNQKTRGGEPFSPTLEYLASDDFQYRDKECFCWTRIAKKTSLPENLPLLNCPFCGGKPKVCTTGGGSQGPDTTTVRCSVCNARAGHPIKQMRAGTFGGQTSTDAIKKHDSEAVELWNKRDG